MSQDITASRRTVLRSLGFTSLGILGTGTGRARQDVRDDSNGSPGVNNSHVDPRNDPVYRRARKLLNQEGREAYEQYVRSQKVIVDDVNVSTSQEKDGVIYPSRRQTTSSESLEAAPDGPTTNSLTCVEPDDDCELQMEVHMYLNNWPSAGWLVDIVVSYRYYMYQLGGSIIGPDSVKDAIAFSWDNNSWDVPTPNYPVNSMIEPEHGDWDGGSYNKTGGGGTLFEVQPRSTVAADASTRAEGGLYWADAGATVNVQQQSGHTDGDAIRGLVRHTWGEVDNNFSFSISASLTGPTIGIGYSSEVNIEEEDIGNDPTGKLLKVTS